MRPRGDLPADNRLTLQAGQKCAWLWIRENDFGDGMKGEHAHIVGHLSNDSTMVIKTEIVGAIGCSGRPGIWGVDEPDPTG